MFTLTSAHLRQLKGAPLAALLAVAIAPGPVTADYIARMTGYTDKPIAQALQYLAELQYITRARSGWILADAQQFALPYPIRNNSDSHDDDDDDAIEATRPYQSASSSSYRKNSELPAEIAANLAAFTAAGYDLSSVIQSLAEQPHITPAYIAAHVESARRNGQIENPLGFALTRMRANDPAPSLPRSSSPADKYLSGPYAAYIQH